MIDISEDWIDLWICLQPEAEDQTQILQKAMLDYLAYNSQSEPAYWVSVS